MKNHSNIGFLSLATLCGALTGCVDYVDRPNQTTPYGSNRPGYAGNTNYYQDEYVYYPDHEVYYNRNRGQYVYQDNGVWLTRTSPRRVSASVLQSSPSVRLDFHDSPQAHHATVAKQYPKRSKAYDRAQNNAQENRGRPGDSDRQDRR